MTLAFVVAHTVFTVSCNDVLCQNDTCLSVGSTAHLSGIYGAIGSIVSLTRHKFTQPADSTHVLVGNCDDHTSGRMVVCTSI